MGDDRQVRHPNLRFTVGSDVMSGRGALVDMHAWDI